MTPEGKPQQLSSEERLERIWNQVVQFFPEAILIVRGERGGLRWRATDTTWSYGATTRYARIVDMGDMEEIEEQSGEDER